ncbi:hypothetical protein QZH41_002903 [Actinostola sp. cb2023]|nr:hypothetical protein QZH41_002903 [Actinostola sp. cb2023]
MSLEERRLYIQTLKIASTVQPYKRVYDEMTSYHPRWFKDVHRLKYFFPWHRWYILEFENFLRQIDCRVTVPYWDWSRAVSSGTLWRASHIRDVWHPGPHGVGGNGHGRHQCVRTGPFSKESWSVCFVLKGKREFCLSREFNSCYSKRLPKRKKVQSLFDFPFEKFEKFEEIVREDMHDDFHNAIGGVMSFEESANAPEFWFHHGYLDKLWGDWQRRGHRFKHQYYHKVDTNMPGADISGSLYMDLSKQPMCVKVIQEQPIDMKELPKEFDDNIDDPVPIYKCHKKE